MPPLNAYIDLHCERTQQGLFEEPLNTLSSLVFVVVAVLLFRVLSKQNPKPFSLKFMIFLCAFIGFGSATFHMTAKMWAASLADVLPITIFAVTFLFLFLRHVLRLNSLGIALMVAVFIIVNLIFKSYFPKAPDGYVSVIPTMALMLLMSLYMFLSKNPSFKPVGIASCLAVIATYFRIIDLDICDSFPYGTHFLWHSLMAVFFYLNLKQIILRYNYAP